MNSEKKTPQEEILEEVKNAEKEKADSSSEAETAGKDETAETAETTDAPKAEEKDKSDKDKKDKKDKKAKKKGTSGVKKVLKSRRFKRGGMATVFTAVFVVVIILINVVVSLLSERFPSMNIDLTANKVNTLSDAALEVAKEVENETTIYILATDDWLDYANNQGVAYSTLVSLSDKLAEANSKIKVEQVDLEKNPSFVNEYADENLTNGCVVVKTDKRYRVLTISDLFPSESNSQTGSTASYNDVDSALATAIKQVNLSEVPVVSIATGHSEAMTDAFDSLSSFLNENAFDVQQFNILSEDIPENTQILFLGTPNTDYTEDELKKLDEYLSEKESGKTRTLLISATPGQASLPNLMSFLEEWGISYDSTSMILESDSSRTFGNSALYLSDVDSENGIPDGDYPLLVTPYSVPVTRLFDSNNSVVTYSLAATSEGSYLQKTDSDEDASETAEKKSYDTAVLARKSLDSSGTGAYANVIVLGSTYMLAPSTLNTSTFSNGDYFIDLAKYATDTTNSNNTVYSPRVQAGVQDITATTNVINFLGLGVFTITIPVVILLAGLAVYIKRRHL